MTIKKICKNNLSGLQKFILNKAYEMESIHISDVLIQYYGFEQAGYGKIKFNRRLIGLNRYLSATSTVSRSFKRLRRRELMIRTPGITSGSFSLTGNGKNAVKRMDDFQTY